MRKILLLLLLYVAAACLKDEPFKRPYAGFEPVQGPDGWEISSPENENMDRSVLEQAYQLVYSDERYLMARSLLVFRNSRLVAEAYPDDPDDIGKYYNIQSCTKSVTSLITGIAVQEGSITSLDEELYSMYPGYFDPDERKRTLTLKDALTMQTGLEFDNGESTMPLYTSENTVQFVLSQPWLYPSGTMVNYNDGAPQLVSKAIEVKTGKILEDYATEKLFNPLGITEWKWERAGDGTTFGAFSLYLKPRDFGKLGQLLLQYGKWQGQPVADSSYLAAATSVQVSLNFSNEPYGYYFWILPEYRGFAAEGHGGQFLLVVPEKELVVVYTAWPYTSGDFFDQGSELMRLIVNSCQ